MFKIVLEFLEPISSDRDFDGQTDTTRVRGSVFKSVGSHSFERMIYCGYMQRFSHII